MKFVYEYRTSDNVRHEGVIAASDREAAFAALKAQGIRPGSVKDAPGFFNKLFGRGKRWLAIGFLALSLVGSIVYTSTVQPSTSHLQPDSPLPRHQVYGDPALMEDFVRSHFRNLMPTEADAYLAHYAQPGVLPALGTNDAAVVLAFERLVADGFEPALELTETEMSCREAAELKRIVKGMREELKRYLSDGVGTPETYLRRLNERFRREQQILLMAQNDLRRTDDDAQWERINGSLRSIGLPTVPRPDEKK